MRQTERFSDAEEAMRIAQDGHQARIWTLLPGIIESWNPAKNTAVVQPTIQRVVTAPDGTRSNVTLPLIPDCPINWPRGGGGTLTFPLRQGDECLLQVASRCIDGWWAQGGVQRQLDARMHDLSDCFCVPGPMSQPKVIPNISTTEVQLRSDDGASLIGINPSTDNIRLVSPTKITLDSPLVVTTGLLQIGTSSTGTITDTNGVTQDSSFGVVINTADPGAL